MQRRPRPHLILGATLALCAAMSLLIPHSVPSITVTVEDGRIACVAELHTDHPEPTT